MIEEANLNGFSIQYLGKLIYLTVKKSYQHDTSVDYSNTKILQSKQENPQTR